MCYSTLVKHLPYPQKATITLPKPSTIACSEAKLGIMTGNLGEHPNTKHNYDKHMMLKHTKARIIIKITTKRRCWLPNLRNIGLDTHCMGLLVQAHGDTNSKRQLTQHNNLLQFASCMLLRPLQITTTPEVTEHITTTYPSMHVVKPLSAACHEGLKAAWLQACDAFLADLAKQTDAALDKYSLEPKKAKGCF